MKGLFYAALGLGIVALAAGAYMYVGMGFHGKAYAAIGVGAVLLIAGVAGVFIGPKAAAK